MLFTISLTLEIFFFKEDIVSHDQDASGLVILEIFLSTPLRQDPYR